MVRSYAMSSNCAWLLCLVANNVLQMRKTNHAFLLLFLFFFRIQFLFLVTNDVIMTSLLLVKIIKLANVLIYSETLLFMRDDVVSQRPKFGSAFLSSSWESKFSLLFNFPVSRARPEKLCDFYWLQLQITCKSGWIAQAEKRYCVSKEGKSKLTA